MDIPKIIQTAYAGEGKSNVRSDATTDSDRIALAYQGDAITEIESYDNGWSKVEYKGQTGYVKTEFLE